MSTLLDDPTIRSISAVAALFFIWLLLALIIRAFERRQSILSRTLVLFRSLVLPLAAILYYLVVVEKIPAHSTTIKVAATLFWGVLIWGGTQLIKALLLVRLERRGVQEQRTPALLIDLIRFPLALVAVFFVLAGIWSIDFGNLLATLGVGSLVLGLALQDTLGNLFAGIALFFEKPFAVGHWIRIGDVTGQLVELNWRAVRLLTRDGDLVIFPNSVLSKERIENYSIPTPEQAIHTRVSFSYDDPPNKVKRVLYNCAIETKMILSDPAPEIRTFGFGDSAVNYDIKFFITDFARLPSIEEELLTRIWYAARRNDLTIPFPTRTVFKTEVPYREREDPEIGIAAVLGQIDLFASLSKEELHELAHAAGVQEFAAGERVLVQGKKNAAFYLIRSGSASISLLTPLGIREELARLGAGQFFGEMSALTGEDCSADVVAAEDLKTIVVFKRTLEALLAKRPSLAEEMAHTIASRRHGISLASEKAQSVSAEAARRAKESATHLGARIRKFFGIQ